MNAAISVAFTVPFSVQIKMAKIAFIYSLTAEPTERGGAKGKGNRKLA